MAREHQGRHGRERGWHREPQGRYSSERARRSVRGGEEDRRFDSGRDEYSPQDRGYDVDDREPRESGQDERGRYRMAGRRDEGGYGDDWPETYRSDFSGPTPHRYRDSWSERQSGPYRSAETGRNISEDQYREEAHWHRSQPHTGFSGRVSEFGYEAPSWGVPQMGRGGGATGTTRRRYPEPGTGFEGAGPRNYARSDDRIREDVCDELSDDGEIDARDIDIEVKDREVTLTGTVPERYMKHRAEDIADSCRGVRDVHNRLRVQRRGGEEERASPSAEGGEQASRESEPGRSRKRRS